MYMEKIPKKKKKKKLLFRFIPGLVVSIIAVIAFCNIATDVSVAEYVYQKVEKIPENKYGLLLGISKTLNGAENEYFANRIKAAALLYHRGKIKYIIASGAKRMPYDGPGDMKRALIALGVPADRILKDDCGYRTLDSIYRAIEVFGLKNFTIISQNSHITRAVYIARFLDLNAIAFAADDSKIPHLKLRSHLREYFAKVKMMLDLYILGMKPKIPNERDNIAGIR